MLNLWDVIMKGMEHARQEKKMKIVRINCKEERLVGMRLTRCLRRAAAVTCTSPIVQCERCICGCLYTPYALQCVWAIWAYTSLIH